MGRRPLGEQARRERHQVWEANQRSAAADRPADLTLAEWRATLTHFGYRCVWCGLTPSNQLRRDVLHLDHLIHDGGTTRRNCVPACLRCSNKTGNIQQPPPRVTAFLQAVGGPVQALGPDTHYAPEGTPLCASDDPDDAHSGAIRTVTCVECRQLHEAGRT